MHLQQTKRDSRTSGGPQYYFHNLTEPVKAYLRKKGAVRVALVTPYGATKTDYFAVSTDKKLDHRFRPIVGNVGHDRVQQGSAGQSIGEAVRTWYRLPVGDFERIDVEIEIIDDAFYLRPTTCKYVGKPKARNIPLDEKALTFTRRYVSELWTQQLTTIHDAEPSVVPWSLAELCRIMTDHYPTPKAHVKEEDLLRASGPLKHLGVALGPYVGKGYDCLTNFTFLDYPVYTVFVEVKKFSRDFSYQQTKYGKDELSRAVILCAVHDHRNLPKNIDVIELAALSEHAREYPLSGTGKRRR